MFLLERQQLGKVEHGVDLPEILDPVPDVLLVGRQVGVQEEEAAAEQDETNCDSTLREEGREKELLMKLLTLVLNCDCDLVLKLSSSGMEQYQIRSLLGHRESGAGIREGRIHKKRRRLFWKMSPVFLLSSLGIFG